MHALLLLLAMAAPADVSAEIETVVTLLEFVLEADEPTAVECLGKLSQKARTGELNAQQMKGLRERLAPALQPILDKKAESAIYSAALELATLWGDTSAATRLRRDAWNPSLSKQRRMLAAETLAAIGDPELIIQGERRIMEGAESAEFQARVLETWARYDKPEIADAVLRVYKKLPPEVKPKAIGLLVQRPDWSKRLLDAIDGKQLDSSVLNVNQLRALLSSRDQELASRAKQQFGSVRTERDPQRERVIQQMRELLNRKAGDAFAGQLVFNRVCGQCHRIHGAGQDVGPDITSNGRSNYDQLLSNVFDPSLVIGPAYQAMTVVTLDGRILTGLLSENNEQRVILKMQGGKTETVPRDEIDEMVPSKLSLMPEGLETQLTPAEIIDLFAFLVLDRPPQDPNAQQIPGTPVSEK